MSSTLLIVLAVVAYTFFGVFVSQAGGRIDAKLSSGILNMVGGLLPLALWLIWRVSRGSAAMIATRPAGLAFSVGAGIAVAVFSILLVTLYARGGELSYVFPVIYGGAIASTAVVGWIVLGETFSWMHLAGVTGIVAGIGLLAIPAK